MVESLLDYILLRSKKKVTRGGTDGFPGRYTERGTGLLLWYCFQNRISHRRSKKIPIGRNYAKQMTRNLKEARS